MKTIQNFYNETGSNANDIANLSIDNNNLFVKHLKITVIEKSRNIFFKLG